MDEDKSVERLHQAPNLPLVVVAGLVSAIVMAIVWAFFTAIIGYMIGLWAILVGFVVGSVINFVSKSNEKIYGINGIIGAICAFVGCVIGAFLSQAVFWQLCHWTYFDTLKLLLSDIQLTMAIIRDSFSSRINLVFYAIAIWAGYYFAVKKK